MNRGTRAALCAAVALTAARHANGAWQMRRTLTFLQTPAAAPPGAEGRRPLTLHLIVPVLWEQAHVAEAMRWFADLLEHLPGSTLTLVSSSREDREREVLLQQLTRGPGRPVTAERFPHLDEATIAALQEAQRDGGLTRAAAAAVLQRMPSTREVIADQLAGGGFDPIRVRHVHYDGPGRKAAQVNTGVTALTDAQPHDFVAVYDVDSRPDPALLHRTFAYVAHRLKLDGQLPAVVQQSARFRTTEAAATRWQRSAARGSARLQTLWTLRREIPALRRYAQHVRSPQHGAGVLLRRGLAQTVGHGLLVRHDIWCQVGGLPEFTTLDDLPFGFGLTVDTVPVDVVPVLATAPAPEQPGDVISQHRRWFASYLDYPACAAAARASGRGTATARAAALAVAGYRGAAWTLASAATGACTVALLHPRTPASVRACAAAALWLGCVTPTRMLAAHDRRSGLPAPTGRDLAAACGEVYLAYLLRSVGPIAALATAGGRRPAALAPKTHRRSLEETR